MARTVGIGIQDFVSLRQEDCFYVDKTHFLREWWNSKDYCTAIMRPRRFGKTLAMSMVEAFFSVKYRQRGRELFGDLSIWQDEAMRQLQGRYPVIFLSFAGIKCRSYQAAAEQIRLLLFSLVGENAFLLASDKVSTANKRLLQSVLPDMSDSMTARVIPVLCSALQQHYEQKAIVILDEYDTPMLEAYSYGYWQEMAGLMGALFNNAFKSNSSLERGLLTGITCIAKESIFSDLNHLRIVTMCSDRYADCFGFTQSEVLASLQEYGLEDKAEQLESWYDGFIIGSQGDIYNPWSIISCLSNGGRLEAYWANTSSNKLVGSLLQQGTRELKLQFDDLLHDRQISAVMDEELVFNEVQEDQDAIWSLLYNSGYLTGRLKQGGNSEYSLWITNFETKQMFIGLVRRWFGRVKGAYSSFIKAMLAGDAEAMEEYLGRVALNSFSSFDVGQKEPERFYHGFVLGLMVDLQEEYLLTSNRESGLGRYDVMLEPRVGQGTAIIMEFKVFRPQREVTLQEAALNAIQQINDRKYAAALLDKGFTPENIYKYGIAFQGKKIAVAME